MLAKREAYFTALVLRLEYRPLPPGLLLPPSASILADDEEAFIRHFLSLADIALKTSLPAAPSD